MEKGRNAVALASAVALIAMVAVAATLTSDFYTPTALLTKGGQVGPIDQPPFFAEAVFGYVNVTAHLFNMSVSRLNLGPYVLDSLAGANRTVAFFVACFQVDSCSIGFWVTNDAALHDYVLSASSVPVNARLSNGDTVSGSITAVDRPILEPGPNGGLVAERLDFISSGRVVRSNLTAVIPLNATNASPVVKVSVGGTTIDSSYFTRPTYHLPLPNGNESVIQGPLELRGPVVYYIMQNVGRFLPVIVSFENGERTNLSLLASSVIITGLLS